jgi:flagellar hook-associated protein 2
MSSGINFGGLSSGLDTEGIITRLVALQKQPIQRIQRQQQALLRQADVTASLKTQISNVAQSANSLLTADAFSAVSPSVSDTAVASIAMSGVGQAGSYNLSVSRLATAQKLSSTPQTSASAALGQTAQFTLNGRLVSVDGTDSLTSIARKINDLAAGATASVIDGGTGNAYLTVTSNNSGINGKPQLADLTGNFLQSVGMVNGATSIRVPITNGAAGVNFTNTTSSIGSALGVTGLTNQTVQVNGVNVTLNLQTDTLQGVADKINAASTGATASVVAVTEGANTKYRLEIKNPSSTPTFVDAGNTLATLGIVQRAPGNQLVAAQDASYTLDGVTLTSSNNTIEGVIPGAKLTLLKADLTTPPTTTITIKNDVDTVANRIKAFTDSYNAAVSFIDDNSKFDGETYETGPLFGDPIARQFVSTMNGLVLSNIPGLTGQFRNLTDVGINIDGGGKLEIDSTKLNNAITTDPESVRKLFQNFGAPSSSTVTYISGTSNTQPSSPSSYAINITQVPTKTRWIAATAKTSNNTSSEVLTFGGNLLGSQSYNLTVDVGSNLQSIIDKINNDVKLKDLVTASNNSGRLQVDAKKFGANGQFTLVSNQSPLGSNSGVGFSAGTLTNGLDVMGTINGETTTGVGLFLTGNQTNGKANGLQVQFNGTSTGSAGTITFTRGMSGIVNSTLNTFTDIANGLTVTAEKAFRDQSEALNKEIEAINKRASDTTTELRAKFANMEERISRIQQQGQRISQLNGQQASR